MTQRDQETFDRWQAARKVGMNVYAAMAFAEGFVAANDNTPTLDRVAEEMGKDSAAAVPTQLSGWPSSPGTVPVAPCGYEVEA